MKFTTLSSGFAAVALASTIGLGAAATASASPVTGTFGTPEKLVDGAVTSTYTVRDLQPSTNVVNVPLAGRLFEATTSVDAVAGTVTPAIPFFNARTPDGQNYRVLFQAPAPAGIKPAPLDQGATTTGKIYFDVTGASPTSVVYNDAVQDRLSWGI